MRIQQYTFPRWRTHEYQQKAHSRGRPATMGKICVFVYFERRLSILSRIKQVAQEIGMAHSSLRELVAETRVQLDASLECPKRAFRLHLG